jgi:ribokinase
VITVIGSANMDLIAPVTTLPMRGETVFAHGIRTLPGGKGANQAVAAARAGCVTMFVARIGTDGHGDVLLSSLQAAGVDTRLVTRDADEPTGLALISVDDEGENTIVVVSGANSRLSPEDVDRARTSISASSAIVLQLESPLETVMHAAKLARDAGVTVILNPAPACDLDRSLLQFVDILVPNEEEVGRVSGLGSPVAPETAAHLLLSEGVGAVIVTLGASGAVIVGKNHESNVAAYRVNARDTTGAGDAFVGNLAWAIDDRRPLEAAVRFATAAAAWSVQHEGAQPSMPTREDTETILSGSMST